jgi:hypothetical protein
MTARCDYIGCQAEDQVEIEITPGQDFNEYGAPLTFKGVMLKLPPYWTTGAFRGVFCPKHPGGVTENASEAIAEEARAHAVECPRCGSGPGHPCHHHGQLVATHRVRRERANGQYAE